MGEAGANENSARSTAFALHAGTSFMLNWHLENQTKVTRGCIAWEQEGERVVVLHIARIDGCYVIAGPCRSRLQRTTSITAATDLALRWLDRELREHFRPGQAV